MGHCFCSTLICFHLLEDMKEGIAISIKQGILKFYDSGVRVILCFVA